MSKHGWPEFIEQFTTFPTCTDRKCMYIHPICQTKNCLLKCIRVLGNFFIVVLAKGGFPDPTSLGQDSGNWHCQGPGLRTWRQGKHCLLCTSWCWCHSWPTPPWSTLPLCPLIHIDEAWWSWLGFLCCHYRNLSSIFHSCNIFLQTQDHTQSSIWCITMKLNCPNLKLGMTLF